MALMGMEVPIIGSDSLRWVEVAVPSYARTPNLPVVVPVTENAASCHVIGDAALYLIWKIRKGSSFALDILELSASKELPTMGLHIIFLEALSPFVYICRVEMMHFEIPHSPECGPINVVAATAGYFVVGRDDGSITCFRFGSLDQNAPGFMHEFREDAMFSRLLGFMSRGDLG